jgi:predicted Fe-Mo cluster-binding NifX family protein
MTPDSDIIEFAVGTDDKVNFSSDHFGSAHFFLIYSLNLKTGEIVLLNTMDNLTPDEDRHGDPLKARNVSELLKEVSIFIGKEMGPNVARIRQKFIPIISQKASIDRALSLIPDLIPDIRTELQKPEGTPKKVLKIRQ